ncbi:MAG: protein TolR [Bdellovibrionota bacterium]
MAMSSGSRDDSAMAEINVTPLVDVMLVLLIIFMVTAPALLRGVPVNLPETRATQLPREKKSLILTVTSGGKIYLGETELPRTDLKPKISAILAEREDKEVYVRSDRRVPYGDVVKLLGDLKAAGVDKVGLVTQEEKIERP